MHPAITQAIKKQNTLSLMFLFILDHKRMTNLVCNRKILLILKVLPFLIQIEIVRPCFVPSRPTSLIQIIVDFV